MEGDKFRSHLINSNRRKCLLSPALQRRRGRRSSDCIGEVPKLRILEGGGMAVHVNDVFAGPGRPGMEVFVVEKKRRGVRSMGHSVVGLPDGNAVFDNDAHDSTLFSQINPLAIEA